LKRATDQMLRFDERSGNLIVLDETQESPMCVTVLPRYKSGLFWPVDNGYRDWGWKYMQGTFVSVEPCLPDIAETPDGEEVDTDREPVLEITKHKGVTREGQKFELVHPDKYNDERGEHAGMAQIRHLRTGMCLSMFPEADGYNDGSSGYVSDYYDHDDSLLPTKNKDSEPWIGIDTCATSALGFSTRSLWFTDAGDNQLSKGDVGLVAAKVSLQEKYEAILLPDDDLGTKDKAGKPVWQVMSSKPGDNDIVRQAGLVAEDFAFMFMPGEKVHETSQGCAMGTVVSCQNLQCSVDGLAEKSYDVSHLSPAEADWPNEDRSKELEKEAQGEEDKDLDD